MNQHKNFAIALTIGILSIGIAFSAIAINAEEVKADEQTYVYTKGDGSWISEGSVRSYDAGDFTLIQRKNDYYSPIPTTYDYLRIYEKHSLEVFPDADLTRVMTKVEITAYTSGYAPAFANAALLAGTSAETAVAQSGLSSVDGNVVAFTLDNISNCEFFKFTVASSAYLSSLKITYQEPVDNEHLFISGDLGVSGTDNNSMVASLSSLDWTISSLWSNVASSFYLGFVGGDGIQVGNESDGVSYLSLRSAIPDFVVSSVEIGVFGQSGIDGQISVIVNGQSISTAQTFSSSSEEKAHNFALATPSFGHIEIECEQVSDKALFISYISVTGYTSLDIIAATAFARQLEAFDSCGDGSGYSALESTAESLSSQSISYLEAISLDDYNDIGQNANPIVQKNVVFASDKWAYLSSRYTNPLEGVFNKHLNNATMFVFIGFSCAAILFCLVLILKRR